jgi:hypothetical protein
VLDNILLEKIDGRREIFSPWSKSPLHLEQATPFLRPSLLGSMHETQLTSDDVVVQK